MDLSSALFSFNGQEPAKLPSRLRLPDGRTRYSHSMTVEEANLCGYVGPIEAPYIKQNQILVWDSSAVAYTVRDKTEEEKKSYLEDVNVRLEVNQLISDCEKILANTSKFRDDYVRYIVDYLAELKKLSNSNLTLSYQDLLDVKTGVTLNYDDSIDINQQRLDAKFPLPYPTQEEFDKAYSEYYELNRGTWKQEYETYGIIYYVEPIFRSVFKVESNWVKGTTPLPADFLPFTFDFRESV